MTNVATSHDSIYWENDAYYEYYKHGPLARTVIGQQQVQGIDYAYTLQGWLKGINSNLLRPSFDMGEDGKSGSQVAKDAFGFAIHYFDIRDYTPVNAAVKPFAAVASNRPLFNGNISGISQNIATIGTPLLYRYEYDVLNRLMAMLATKGLDTLQNSWTNGFGTIQDFKELITYDRNGNILTYIRNGNKTFAGSPIGMDSLTYHYRPGTNKLSYVTDLVRDSNYGNDIDNQQIDNYKYDSIGNMVSDVRSGVDSIKWNVYGKVARIYKHDTTTIIYAYDAAGNRISKSVISKAKDTVQTFYVRDATGNILSTYAYRDTSVNNGQVSQIEVNLYGSSRLGMTTLATNVQDPTPAPKTNIVGLGYGENITFTRGKKFFELTNHLGNVLATVSDRKVGVSVNNTTIDSYNPVINSAQEYYPFGMLMPGRGGRIGAGRNVAGSTVVVGGDTIPATLVVNQRAGNTPGTYMATERIDFEDEFNSGDGDSFTTLFVDQGSADPGTESGVSYGIDGKGYRYGFNGQEKSDDIKGEGNSYTAQFWEYDPRIGKRWNIEPKLKLGESPYLSFSDNPVSFSDPLGDSSVFDPMGNVIHYEANDKDKRVFMLNKDKSMKPLGYIGGRVDINEIAANIIAANTPIAQGLSENQWVLKVLPNHIWDYKNNKNTIFGVIWAEDLEASKTARTREPLRAFQFMGTAYYGLYSNGEIGPDTYFKEQRTKFTYKSYEFNGSADFGNYHAGYMGTQALLDRINQFQWAGLGELYKLPTNYQERIRQLFYSIPPYGDQPIDHLWNRHGMIDAEAAFKLQPNLIKMKAPNTELILKFGPYH